MPVPTPKEWTYLAISANQGVDLPNASAELQFVEWTYLAIGANQEKQGMPWKPASFSAGPTPSLSLSVRGACCNWGLPIGDAKLGQAGVEACARGHWFATK